MLMSVGSAVAQDQSGPMVNIADGPSVDAYGFDPSTLTVNAGDTVTWTNTGSLAHTVTAVDGAFDSGNLNSGETTTVYFDTPGTYSYLCAPHPWMKGTITVSGG